MSWRAFLESASKGPTLNILRYGVRPSYDAGPYIPWCPTGRRPECECVNCNPPRKAGESK